MKLTPPKHSSRASGYRLPMTSMIDVVFLLLVFFLVTTSFSAEEDRLSSAASVESSGTPPVTGPVVLEIVRGARGDEYVLGERRLAGVSELTEVLRALRSEQGLVIRAENTVSIASVAAAMQAAENAGHTTRSYVGTDDP